MTGFTRRGMVGGLALAGLAGCIGFGDGESDAVFEAVRVDGTRLVVELAGSVDSVTVVSPDGSEFASRSVGTGVSKVSVGLGVRYTPGEHTVVASREGEAVGETTIDIRPDVAIVAVGVGANHLGRMPESLNYRPEQVFFGIKNTGTGPELLQKFLVLGDVPNPTTDLRQQENSTGVHDTSDGYGDFQRPIVGAGETQVFYSTTMPFLVAGNGVECKSSPQTGTCQVTIVPKLSADSISQAYQVRYAAAETRDGCSGRITGRAD